jgi:hypothetical protein
LWRNNLWIIKLPRNLVCDVGRQQGAPGSLMVKSDFDGFGAKSKLVDWQTRTEMLNSSEAKSHLNRKRSARERKPGKLE